KHPLLAQKGWCQFESYLHLFTTPSAPSKAASRHFVSVASTPPLRGPRRGGETARFNSFTLDRPHFQDEHERSPRRMRRYDNASSRAFASRKSIVSNPSVNRLKTSERRLRASSSLRRF